MLDVVCVLRNEVSQQACLCFFDELLQFPSLSVLSLPFFKHPSRSQTSHSIEVTNAVSFKGTAHPNVIFIYSLSYPKSNSKAVWFFKMWLCCSLCVRNVFIVNKDKKMVLRTGLTLLPGYYVTALKNSFCVLLK